MTKTVTHHIDLQLFTLSLFVTLIQLGHPQYMRIRGSDIKSLFYEASAYCTQTNFHLIKILDCY